MKEEGQRQAWSRESAGTEFTNSMIRDKNSFWFSGCGALARYLAVARSPLHWRVVRGTPGVKKLLPLARHWLLSNATFFCVVDDAGSVSASTSQSSASAFIPLLRPSPVLPSTHYYITRDSTPISFPFLSSSSSSSLSPILLHRIYRNPKKAHRSGSTKERPKPHKSVFTKTPANFSMKRSAKDRHMTSSPSAPSHPPLPPPLHISSNPKNTNEIITDLHPKPPPPKKTKKKKHKIVNNLQNSDRSHIIDLHPFLLVLNPPLFSIPKTLLFLLDYSFTHAITTTNKPIIPHLSSERANERASERPISPPPLAQLHKKQGTTEKTFTTPTRSVVAKSTTKRGTSESPKNNGRCKITKKKPTLTRSAKRKRERRSLALFVEFNNRINIFSIFSFYNLWALFLIKSHMSHM